MVIAVLSFCLAVLPSFYLETDVITLVTNDEQEMLKLK